MDRIIYGAGTLVKNVFFFLLVILIVALIAAVIAIRSSNTASENFAATQQQLLAVVVSNGEISTTNKEILKQLLDCTEPKGECAKRGAAAQAAQSGAINAITMAAAVCADAPGVITLLDMRDCVGQFLKVEEK